MKKESKEEREKGDLQEVCFSGGRPEQVASVESPCPNVAFGDIGRFVEVRKSKTLAYGANLRLEIDKSNLRGMRPSSLRLFRWNKSRGSLHLISKSGYDSRKSYVWGEITEPGIYGVFGLPIDDARLTTIRLIRNLDKWGKALERVGGDVVGFRQKICQLILCAPEFQKLHADPQVLEEFGMRGFPLDYPGSGNICDECFNIAKGGGGGGSPDSQLIDHDDIDGGDDTTDWFTDRRDLGHSACDESDFRLPPNVRWIKELPGPIYSSPIAGHGNVYVGCDDNRLYALAPFDGSIQWSFDAGAKVSTAATAVAEGDFSGLFITAENGRLYSIDPRTGIERWHVDGNNAPFISSPNYFPETDTTPSLIAYVYQLQVSSKLRVVNAQTGDVLWEDSIGNISSAPPMNSGEGLFVGARNSGTTFIKYDPVVGTELWSFRDHGDTSAAPFLYPGSYTSGVAHLHPANGNPALVITSTRYRTIRGLNLASGDEVWQSVLPDAWEITGFALTRERDPNILVVSQAGDRVYGLNPETGAQLWRFDCPSSMSINQKTPRPIICGNHVFYASGGAISPDPTQVSSSRMYALSIADGSEQWAFDLDGPVFSSAMVEDGYLYIGTLSGSVYSFSPSP